MALSGVGKVQGFEINRKVRQKPAQDPSGQ